MELEAAKMIGAGLASIALAGAGVGIGIIFGNYLSGAMRNPSAAQKQFPNLLLGFAFAGLLSVLVSQEQIESKIGSSNFRSTLKAVLYGIPLPLCSCGVIPVATSLKKHGASKGAVISFITTTPQTGVDSIMLTYGMLGAPILILKLLVALISGLFAGVLTNLYDTKKTIKDNRKIEKKYFK